MLPKKSKHYILPTALDLELDPQMIEDVVGFYYSTVRKTLVDLESHNIYVENLGSFRIKQKELPKLVDKYNKHLSVLTKDTFNQMALKKETELKLQRVERVQEIIREEKERKTNFYNEKKLRKNMASPKTDS